MEESWPSPIPARNSLLLQSSHTLSGCDKPKHNQSDSKRRDDVVHLPPPPVRLYPSFVLYANPAIRISAIPVNTVIVRPARVGIDSAEYVSANA